MAVETDLAVLYRDVSARITNMLLRVRRDGGKVTPTNRQFIIAQLKRLGLDMVRLDALTDDLVRKVVAPAFMRASDQAQRTIARAGLPITQPQMTRFEHQALVQLEARISTDLRAVRAALGEALVLNDPIRRGPKAVEAALREDGKVQLHRGQAAVQVPSGKFWRADAYASMLSRTAVADARREAFRGRYEANGVDLVEVIANGTAHSVCAAWEGVVCSLTGATPGYPTIGEARAAGLFHPNCRHRYVVATGDDIEQREVPLRARAVTPQPQLRSTLGLRPPRTPQTTLRR